MVITAPQNNALVTLAQTSPTDILTQTAQALERRGFVKIVRPSKTTRGYSTCRITKEGRKQLKV